MKPVYYLAPFICAVIGWGTNFLAIKMLFRPHRERKIFNLRFQGVLPRRQACIAEAIGEAVEKELIKKEDLAAIFRNMGKEKVSLLADKIIDEKFKLYKLNSIYFVDKIHRRILAALKSFVKKEVINTLDTRSDLSGHLASSIDIRGLVTKRINGFSTQELEKAAFAVMNKELRFVELMGAVIGFIIGTIQLALYAL